jgi:hypothetical protein
MPVISSHAPHSSHVCWWSRNRLCELRWDGRALSGSGIDGQVVEAACADIGACLVMEPKSEEDTALSVLLPGLETVSGHLHGDCFFQFTNPPAVLTRAMIRSILEHLLIRHTGLAADLAEIASGIAEILQEQGHLRFRAEPIPSEIAVESQRRTWPFGARRFRALGFIRFPNGTARLELPGPSAQRK